MKSVLTSFWLFAVSIGNIIVLIIAEARFLPKQVSNDLISIYALKNNIPHQLFSIYHSVLKSALMKQCSAACWVEQANEACFLAGFWDFIVFCRFPIPG